MLNNRLRHSFKLLSRSYITKKAYLKCLSTTETLTPVKLAFTSYENATATSQEPPFVILHGLFGSKQNWNSLCQAYKHKINPPRKIIALDLRNHGESAHSDKHSYALLAEDVKYFLVENKIDKIILMGHSMGGRCAMLFALTYPELVQKLVIVDISPVTQSPHFQQMPSILTAMQKVEFPTYVTLSEARTIVDKQLVEYNIANKDLRAFLLTNVIQIDNKRYKWRLNVSVLVENFDHIARFPSIENLEYAGETLFLGGGNSSFIPRSDYSKIKKLFPNAELKYIDGAGHWVHSEKPHEFLKVTLEFLNKAKVS